MLDYSVIIPHYNDAEDLERCLASIPVRDDLEVIVVDDDSDPGKVDFEHFPGLDRPGTTVIFSKGKDGKGPGYARNVGMGRAQGKWIVFSDSDDYFLPVFGEMLDSYKDSDADVVYFKVARQTMESDVLQPYGLFNDAIDEAKAAGKPDAISFGVPSPCGKFIKRDFLSRNGIGFQQITGGDDMLFTTKIGLNLQRYELSDAQVYCVVDRPGSITRNNSWRGFRSFTRASLAVYRLLAPVGKEKMAYNWTASWWGRLRAENRWAALALLPEAAATMGLMKSLHCYKKAMKVKRWNWKES